MILIQTRENDPALPNEPLLIRRRNSQRFRGGGRVGYLVVVRARSDAESGVHACIRTASLASLGNFAERPESRGQRQKREQEEESDKPKLEAPKVARDSVHNSIPDMSIDSTAIPLSRDMPGLPLAAWCCS